MSQRRSSQPRSAGLLSGLARRSGILSAWHMAAPAADAGGVLGLTPIGAPTREVRDAGVGAILNGSSQYFTGSDRPMWAFGPADFLMMATFRTTATSISMLVARNDGSGTTYYLSTDGTGKMRTDVGAAILSNSVWNDGKIHTCVWVRRNGVGEFYVDGVYDGGGTSNASITGTGSIVLGKYGTSSSFYLNGAMFMAAIGNRAPNANVCRELSRNPWAVFAGLADDVVGNAAAGGVTLALTGQSASVALGTTSASVVSALTSQSASVTTGTLSAAISTAVTSQSVSAATDTVSTVVTAAITGQSTAVATGTITASGASTAAITGQSVGVAQGTVVAGVSVAITGQSASVAAGIVVAGVLTATTGQSAGVATGSVSAAVSAALTSQSLPVSVGSVSLPGAATAALTGQAIAVGQGAVAAGVSIALTGQLASVTTGAVVAGVSRALTGQSTGVAIGNVSASVSLLLVGQFVIAGRGSVTILGASTSTPTLSRTIAIPSEDRTITIV